MRVRRYDVSVEPGTALAPEGLSRHEADDVDAVAPPAAYPGTTPADLSAEGCGGQVVPEMGGLAKGPYVAETYPVSVEQEYIVVELRGAASTLPGTSQPAGGSETPGG